MAINLRLWFWSGLVLTLAIKVVVALWQEKRERNGDFRWGTALLDFFFLDAKTITTTILTISVGWILVTVWLGEIVDFVALNVSFLPKHNSVAFFLGIICEGIAAPVMHRVSSLLVPKEE